MTSRKINQNRMLSFQQLENRMLMAGNVAVSVQNHSLFITGDNHGNSFEISQTGNGQYTITPIVGGNSTINRKTTPQTFTGVTRDFNINMQGGTNEVLFYGPDSAGSLITIPRNLNVKMGSGDDGLTMEDVVVAGGASINLGSGYNDMDLDYSHIGNPSVNGGKNDCAIDLGQGINDDLDLDYTTVERNLTIKGESNTGGGDSISLTGGVVGGNLTVQTGSGDDWVTIDEYLVQKQLNIQTGDGNDIVVLGEFLHNDGTGQFVPGVQYGISADSIFVDLGKGDDNLHLSGANAKQATYSGGAGHDQVFHDAADFGSESFNGFEFESDLASGNSAVNLSPILLSGGIAEAI